MRDWRRQVAAGHLKPGTTLRFTRNFSAADVEAFGHITRDYNPVHYEPRFCRLKGFSSLICHGLLVGSMICEPGGQWAWLATGMTFEFLKPVYVGETIVCEMTLLEVDDRRFARAEAVFTNRREEVVMRAELSGFLPNTEERELLSTMVAEGDPTNPLAP